MKEKDKVCVITGATNGIGKVATGELARTGMTIVFTYRNKEKAERSKAEFIEISGNKNIEAMYCDLSSFKSIQEFCSKFLNNYNRLDLLINNAGIWERKRSLSADGIEMTFAVNHLAPFLMTHLLLDVIKNSTPARIVNVSSGLHMRASLDFDDLENKKSFRGMNVYARSKLANILFTKALSKRLKGKGVTVNCLTPGFTATGLSRNANPLMRMIVRLIAQKPEKGARTLLHTATSRDVEGITGEYFSDNKIKRSSDESRDEGVAERLWKISEKYLTDYLD